MALFDPITIGRLELPNRIISHPDAIDAMRCRSLRAE
jgi:2,4-dienoyl-CoA reductase-like NADH-dependent reductase (Old Yellow Enzyme family)